MAAMDGWRIQSWRRLTDSSWRFSISARMASRSPGCACAQRGIANVAAVAAAAAAAPCRKMRRSDGEKVVFAFASLSSRISTVRFFACSFLLLPELDAFAMAASLKRTLNGIRNQPITQLHQRGRLYLPDSLGNEGC